jgi:two-component system, cell cycle sensor histidine kinase and response regulator CckA
LGLAAVLGIVKGHKGDIEVASRPGTGTTFTILLPACERADAKGHAPKFFLAGDSARLTILVVDDEEIVIRTATTALESRGFSVVTASNGSEAIDVLRKRTEIAFVILDLTMPIMTGEQAIPLIRDARPDLPIILTSGYNEAEISRRFTSSGIADVLQKPYTLDALISKVKQGLQTQAQLK